MLKNYLKIIRRFNMKKWELTKEEKARLSIEDIKKYEKMEKIN